MDKKTKTFLLAIRQALLSVNDALERYLDLRPTTSQIRKEYKKAVTGRK